MVVLSVTSLHTVPRWRNELESLTRTLSGTFSEESSDRWEEFFVERCRSLRPGLVLLGQSAWRPGMESTAEKIARNLTDTPLLIIPLNIREHRKEVFR